jgi:hypothetical protein
MSIKEVLKQKRPNLSVNSLTTYNSILSSLYKKVFGNIEVHINKFNDTKEILDFLKSYPPNKRKTILSALVVISDEKSYRDLMLEDIKTYNQQIDKQEKSPAQVASWVDANEIQTIYDKLKDNALFLYKKKDLGMNDLQNIQDYIILSLLGGIFIPPRRSLDYCAFKINNVDKEKDNYIDKNLMTFNTYKTAKFYHQQQLEIPKELKIILTKWVKVNPTDYLLFDSNKNGLNSVKLNQRLNNIFGGRKIAVNQMRHTYLTDKYVDTINKNKQINTDLTEMGSSGQQAKVYIKQ